MNRAFAAALFLLTFATAARADAGLDLVVLVDRSASMARNAGTTSLFLLMTVDLVGRNAVLHHVEHRLAVIGFGSTASVDVPLTPAGHAGLPGLRRSVKAIDAADRGNTDVLAAFAAAETLFRSVPADPERRRAILLLTDGVPYVRGADMAAYGAELRRFVAAHFPAARVSIDILLQGPRRHERHERLWRDLTGGVHIADRAPDEMLAAAHGVVTSLVGTKTTASTPVRGGKSLDMLVVPPYLDFVVLDVFRGSPAAEIEVFPPGRTEPIRGGAGGVESVGTGELLETLVVPRPVPGRWTIRKVSSDARVRILSQQFCARGTLIMPAAADALRQYDVASLGYRLADSRGTPLVELPGYPISLDVTLTRPDGLRTVVAMERDPEHGPSGFRSLHVTECDLPGRYWTDVRVTAVDAARNRLEVFRDRWSGFSVAPAERIDCRVSTPGGVMWLPMPARIDCAERGQLPVNMESVTVGAPGKLFRAALIRDDGARSEASVDLRHIGGGAFRGWLRATGPPGNYEIQLGVDRSRLRSAYNIRFIPRRLSVSRWGALAWLAVPLAVLLAALLVRRMRWDK